MEIGLGAAIDSDIWQYARDSGRIVISKDEDFVHLANRQPPTGRVIWVRLGNCRTARLITEFEGLWPRIQAAVEAGDRVIEIR
jgi:predicted nuclease of predicted toxin-antitoxin system